MIHKNEIAINDLFYKLPIILNKTKIIGTIFKPLSYTII